MTSNEYQKLAMRTAGTEDKERLLMNGALGICGEAGEVADLIKKTAFQGHNLDVEHLIEECGDCCWYLAILCEAVGTTLETVMTMNIDKLKRRYPDGFSTERSINREE